MTREVVLSENRDFKGVWIPKELYLNNTLTWNEKIILIEIDSLSKNGKCFASNQHFANLLGISKKRVETIISELRKKGYITSVLIYKKESKQVDKRILRVVDSKGFTNNSYLSSEIGVGILESEDSGILDNEGDKNTSIKNTNEESTNIDNKENIPIRNCSVTNIEDKAGKWEWQSDKQYVDYIEKVLPKMIKNLASEHGKKSNTAYNVFLTITVYYFRQFRVFNGSYHPWYKEDTIKECINGLFSFFDGHLNTDDVKEYINQFFTHKNLRGKPFKVFCSTNMLETIRHEIYQDWNEEYY